MRIAFHHNDKVAVWDEETTHIVGTQYIIDRLAEVWEYRREPVRLTETGPDARPSLLSVNGALACGLVAGFRMTTDEPERFELPKGAIP